MTLQQKLHIYEETANLFWSLVVLISTATGAFFLAGTFNSENWSVMSVKQVAALLLFFISFSGIFKLSESRYHFIFYFKENKLVIDIHKGNVLLNTHSIATDEIKSLAFVPSRPRTEKEALFDFAHDYHLVWKRKNSTAYQQLIPLQSAHFTLKVDDIGRIMHFVKRHTPGVNIPAEQADYFSL
ncbi:hypothetical protein [Fodinibius sediminis]|uniref:PH domain-containing protein n=1 Tax=Fodinibius sediminis TaxID=1214077 RepID=A0A521DAP0_9BACT|nr:hypothetical protein [Fodinibius sediminis]SMO68662.1 hypothetical protein SAMN06265218_10986 [Fodinibius sediminis]